MNMAPKRRAVRTAAQIGHNGGPNIEPFGIRSEWLTAATDTELRQLAKLHLRIERRRAGLAGLMGERRLIMMRCIRRLRRASGRE